MERHALVLIDTSAWIEALRRNGNSRVRERVRGHMQEGRAVWCEIVALELWNGARGTEERRLLKRFEDSIPMLPINSSTWSKSKALARALRNDGQTVPVADIIIAACAIEHAAEIEHHDRHFEAIFKVMRR